MPHRDEIGGTTLFVGDLASFADEQHIEQVFLDYGFEVVDVKLMRGKQSMSSLGYGFVTMRSNNDAMRAISALDSKLVYGRKLRVKWAVPNMKNKKNSDPVNSVYVKFQALTVSLVFICIIIRFTLHIYIHIYTYMLIYINSLY